MADNIVAKSATPVDTTGDNTPAGSNHSTTDAGLSSKKKDSSGQEATPIEPEKKVVNFVKGVPRYLLAFGVICSVFCVSASAS